MGVLFLIVLKSIVFRLSKLDYGSAVDCRPSSFLAVRLGFEYRLVYLCARLFFTSWFKLNDGNYPPHECLMQYIWYHTDCHELWKSATWPLFLFRTCDIGLAQAAKTCPHPPQPFIKVDKGQEFA